MITLHGHHFPKNRRFYLLLGGNVIVLILIALFVLRPVVNLLVKHTTEITKERAEIAGIQQKTAALRKLKEAYPAYAAVYQPILGSLPKTRDVAGYQTELEDLAKLTSVQLVTIDTSGKAAGASGSATASTPSSPAPAKGNTATPSPAPATAPTTTPTSPSVGGFQTIPVKADVTGTYATILDFLHRLETMDRFTRVTALQIQSESRTGAVKATIEMQTFYVGGAL
jgi:Tfp pilus assembly protein PilO